MASQLLESGLESRVELRRRRVPCLADEIARLASFDLLPEADEAWITRSNGESQWRSSLDSTNLKRNASEHVGLTWVDGPALRVAIYIDDDRMVAELDGNGLHAVARDDPGYEQAEALTIAVRRELGTRIGVIYFALQDSEWRIARISLQIPYWIASQLNPWFYSRLLKLFMNAPASTREDNL